MAEPPAAPPAAHTGADVPAVAARRGNLRQVAILFVDLLARRRQLVAMLEQEKTRLLETGNAKVRADIEDHIEDLDRRVALMENEIQDLVRADPALREIERRLRPVPGVGPIVALTLIAEFPELCQLDRRAIATLAGLAPIARDSGKRAGRRELGWPAGRPHALLRCRPASLQA